MSIADFMKRYGYLKAKYGQQLTMHNAMAVANSIATKRDPTYWDAMVDDYIASSSGKMFTRYE